MFVTALTYKKSPAATLGFCFLLLAALHTGSALAADYYVSSSSGSDANNGLSPGAPLNSLGAVNGLALQPGDRILFKSGDTWQGMLWPKGSGSISQPIEIASYDGSVKPVLDGDGYQASLLIYNDDYYEIRELELTNQASHLGNGGQAKTLAGFGGAANDNGSGENIRFGLKIVAAARSLVHFRINDLHIRDIYPTPADSANQHKGYGIKFESQSDLGANQIRTISDVIVDGVEVTATGHYGIWIRPEGLTGTDDHKHFDYTFRNSSLLDTGGAGVVVVKAQNVLAEHNVFDGTGSSNDPRMYKRGSGIWPFDSKDVVIQHNKAMNARGSLDSYGVHIDYNNENVVVQYNFSYNNEGGFAQILGSNINCGYRYNISVADGSRIQGVNGAQQNGRIANVSDYCLGSCFASVGNFIYNNTVYVPNTIAPDIVLQDDSGETFFANNLIAVEPGGPVLGSNISNSGTTLNIRNNLFYPQSAFSLDPALTAVAPVFRDPKLFHPGFDIPGFYQLKIASAAKRVGAIVTGSANPLDYSQNNGGVDYFGNVVTIDMAPHIGAFNGNEMIDEFEAPLATPAALLAFFALLLAIAQRRLP